MSNNKGSSAWMAPEVFIGNNYSEKCDIFSWGIILWQCLSRKQPYSKYDNEYALQWAKVTFGKNPPMFRNCPSKLKDLLKQCWNQNPSSRLSMDEIVPIMQELFSYCNLTTLQPLKLLGIQNKRNKVNFITNVPTIVSYKIFSLKLFLLNYSFTF